MPLNPLIISLWEKLIHINKNPSFENALQAAHDIAHIVQGTKTWDPKILNVTKHGDKVAGWFHMVPWLDIPAAQSIPLSLPVDFKVYWLRKSSKQRMAGAVNFTENYEDDPILFFDKNIGIDIIIPDQPDRIFVVLSSAYKLRVLELHGDLTVTQQEILQKWSQDFTGVSQKLIHEVLWQSFNLKSLNQKFYEGIARKFTELVQFMTMNGQKEDDAKHFTNRLIGRIIFLWFLRKKNIINETPWYFDPNSANYYLDKLSILFFETLNKPIEERNHSDLVTPYLNGGLFESRGIDRNSSITFPKAYFREFYDFLAEYNFTTDESTSSFEQVAIDPEMLGRIFENLLAEQVTETGEQARKAKWAFYTPREIVDYMCLTSLKTYLDWALKGANLSESDQEKITKHLFEDTDSQFALYKKNVSYDSITKNRWVIIQSLDNLTILDPACGSWAFPMGIMQAMIRIYERVMTDASFKPTEIKLGIIERSLFWVDIEPMAVEIARLRAWLSIIVEEPNDSKHVKPLPNLDFKFVCANSLIPLTASNTKNELKGIQIWFWGDHNIAERLQEIRWEYFRSKTQKTKKALRDEFKMLTAPSFDTSDFTTKLRTYHPFDSENSCAFFDSKFMFGKEEGFDVVIGNPPYGGKLTKENKDYFKTLYSDVHMRTPDTFNYFISLSFRLLKKNGISCYIVPNNLLFQTEYEKTRSFLIKTNSIKVVMNLGDGIFESATVPSCVFLCQKSWEELSLNKEFIYADMRNAEKWSNIDFRKYLEVKNTQRHLEVPSLVFGVSNVNLDLIQKLEKQSVSIDMISEEMASGISTWWDQIFNLSESKYKEMHLENELLRKVLVGGDINRYTIQYKDNFLLYMNKSVEIWNYPYTLNYLSEHKEKLSQKRETVKWMIPFWCLHWPRYPELFTEEKIILRQTADKIIATYDNDGYFVLDSILVLKLKKESIFSYKFILGILNSSISQFLYSNFTQEKGRTFAQVKSMNVRKLYIPNIWKQGQQPFVDLVNQILELKKQNPKVDTTDLEKQIDSLVYELYGLTEEEIALVEGIN